MSPLALPDFPWDSLEPAKARAAQHPDGIVDLSVGTPVDPTPQVVQDALVAASNAPGYPLTIGTPALREALVDWHRRRRGVTLDTSAVLPTIGSKELVAWLPTFLGLGAGDIVGIPEVAYPTYDVGARLAGATPQVVGSLTVLGPLTAANRPKLLWINSPGNPHGKVLGTGHLRKVVEWGRQHGVIIASDECYAELDWRGDDELAGERQSSPRGTTPSILDPEVCGDSHEGLLAAYSLSKQSNLAGYRGAFIAGDPELIARITHVRKHAGMLMPAPVQAAMVAALRDETHVAEQKARYAARRATLRAAVEGFGLRIDDSQAGLYLWATRGEGCWSTVEALAEHGILVAPGAFYGAAGAQHVRIALTASDERIAAAAARLSGN